MADLRIFSYLPNPRIYKATVAARYCDVDIVLRSAAPHELADWLWDFDARLLRVQLSLPKTRLGALHAARRS